MLEQVKNTKLKAEELKLQQSVVKVSSNNINEELFMKKLAVFDSEQENRGLQRKSFM